MTFNITIGSDQSSITDEEDSSGVQVSPPSDSGSHEYQDPYDEWAHLPYPDELKPSDSASRPRTAHRTRSRNPIHSSRSASGRRHASRHNFTQEREPFPRRPRRPRRPPSPESPESVDSAEEYGGPYDRPARDRRFWPPMSQGSGYTHSPGSGSPYVYPRGASPHGPFGHPNGSHHPSDQLIRFGHHGQIGQPTPYGHPLYAYGAQFHNQHPGAPISPFFAHEHPGNLGRHSHHLQTVHAREDARSPQQPLPHPHGPLSYGGPSSNHHDLVPYGPGGYHLRDSYPMVPGMVPPYFGAYPRVPSPSQVESNPSPAPPPADTAKDEAIARLEKLILEERTEREAREAREAAREAAIEKEASEQAAREERAAHEKQIAEDAAAAARAEAEKEAAEEAAKAKKEAEEAAAAAAAEAATAATEAANEAANAATAEAVAAATAAASNQPPPPPEKKKPIKFKDAVGRKFSFPFELCCTWQGMEELIRQAFLHIEVIGPHVADGHYDLVGPNGDIILPQVWDTVIEPDWTITMHMWPIPEKPKTPEPQPAPETPAAPEAQAAPEAPEAPEGPEAPDAPDATPPDEGATAPEEPKKKPDLAGAKKQRQKAPDPGAFAMWMVGSHRLRLNKTLKAEKKPKVIHQHQHGMPFRVMRWSYI